MPDYAILIYPAANRVYAEASRQLLRAELAVFSRTVLSTPVADIAERVLGGVGYLTFRTSDRLSDTDVAYLSNLSTGYALFELDGEVLRPLDIEPIAAFDSDLLTIQKYPGKTNELFTKLLLNVTMLATSDPKRLLAGGAHVLDPLCGRGTTLNQAMMYGFDATGVEADGKDFDAYCQFIKTWLRNKRVKHSAETIAIRRNKVQLGNRIDIEYGRTKQQYKAGETRTLAYLNCDTSHTGELLKANSADVVVTDAPYGIQHGSQRPDKAGLTRDPVELLAAALPGWLRVLRPGGAVGISWNTNVTARADLVAVLTDAGLDIATDPGDDFTHRVDQAIARDLIVAKSHGGGALPRK